MGRVRRGSSSTRGGPRVSRRGRGRVLEAVEITVPPALLRRDRPAFWVRPARAVLDVASQRCDLADWRDSLGPRPDLVVREESHRFGREISSRGC